MQTFKDIEEKFARCAVSVENVPGASGILSLQGDRSVVEITSDHWLRLSGSRTQFRI